MKNGITSARAREVAANADKDAAHFMNPRRENGISFLSKHSCHGVHR
jgi:hypothetical protein